MRVLRNGLCRFLMDGLLRLRNLGSGMSCLTGNVMKEDGLMEGIKWCFAIQIGFRLWRLNAGSGLQTKSRPLESNKYLSHLGSRLTADCGYTQKEWRSSLPHWINVCLPIST